MKFLFVKMQKGEEKEIAVFPVNIDDNKVNLSDDVISQAIYKMIFTYQEPELLPHLFPLTHALFIEG